MGRYAVLGSSRPLSPDPVRHSQNSYHGRNTNANSDTDRNSGTDRGAVGAGTITDSSGRGWEDENGGGARGGTEGGAGGRG
jgi:hypothetical protein